MATIIHTPAELRDIENDLAGDYELGNDITGYDGYTPIGDTTHHFTGTLDGKGYKITGNFSTPYENLYFRNFGLFFYCEGATISNLIFEDCTITYNAASGKEVYAAFLTEGTDSSIFSNIQFLNCDIAFTMQSGDDGFSGLLVAETYGGDSISQVYSDSDCSITATVYSYSEIGMLMGLQRYSCAITQCAMKGTMVVTGGGNYIGGITGYGDEITISNSYSQVNITGTSGDTISGLMRGDGACVITNCYASGTLTGGDSIYGLCDDRGQTVTSSYWLDTCGGTGGLGTSKTDAELKTQATFTDWDFSTIWGISDSYPYLLWTAEAITTTIETLAAKNVFDRSATIGGEYTAGDATHVEMGIQWRPKGLNSWVTYWWAQSPYYIAWNLVFWYTMSGLGPGRTYEYRAFYKIGATYTYGSTLTFTTTTIPAVFNYPGTEYRTAKQAIDDVAKMSLGRYYADAQGNFQYESRLRRMA